MPVPRSVPVWPSRWIWITASLVVLAIASLLIILAGNESVPDYGSHLLWFW
ncbi:hypothetical protein [Mesorhizobium comanense]|uniref:hypothetical protein n=1 Tax=Mesorhizobium comanense TaxID=2502215 RepID=UPI001484E7E0|nr:hypothetical protein [Mesorhizobium comanense]